MTVTLPADLAAEVEGRLGANGDGNRSRFVADALRTHLHQLRLQDMTSQAARLDPDEELAWALPVPPNTSNPTSTTPPSSTAR